MQGLEAICSLDALSFSESAAVAITRHIPQLALITTNFGNWTLKIDIAS